ncbi:PA14 domain-containing protein [Aliiroseovarius sp. YM-037]|uniref:PA14 domain-containing protein n=1 Tax=Aliiroseovarius sp. YM-037 TaxID=3341728 RepID=UPI003A8003F4
MSLFAEFFALPSGISNLSQIDFDAEPTATDTVDQLDTMHSNDPFWAGGRTDDFAARYTGNLNINKGGTYTFYLSSDDGSALYIDGTRVIGNDGLHWTIEESVTLDLSAGAHDIEVRYFEQGGAQSLALDWQGPDSDGSRVTLSGSSISHGGVDNDDGGHDDGGHDDGGHDDNGHDDGGTNAMSGLRASYYALASAVSSLNQIDFDATPTATGMVEQLDTMRSFDAFWEGGVTDDFAARYTGDLNVEQGGTYTFYLSSDDGSALYIDGEMVIGNDGLHGTQEESVTLDLAAGAHDIEIRYFERGGAQTLALDWQGPDSNGARETITGDSFSHGGEDDGSHDDGDHNDGGHDDGDNDDGGHDDGGHDDGGHDDGGHDDGGTNPISGLRASYFALSSAVSSLNQIDFDATPTATGMVDQLNTMRSFDAFWDGGVTDDFAARYTGDLNVEQGGTYTFYLSSDDGSALYIDGARVIGNDGLHGTREESVTIDLSAGAHDIEVLYFERGGAQTLALDWQGPDSNGTRETISGDSFSHGGQDDGSHDDGGHDDGGHDDGGHDDGGNDDGGHDDGGHDDGGTNPMSGLRASYFALASAVSSLNQIDFDATPTATGMVDQLDTMRSFDAFWDGGVTDDFAAQYTGDLNVEQGGTYTFYLSSDDGSALYIDGEMVIGNDGLHGTQEESVTLNLSAGAHDIEVQYFERGGAQTLALDWEGPDSNGARETISGDSFSHAGHDDGGHDDGGHDDGGHDDGGHDDGGNDDGGHDDGGHDDGGHDDGGHDDHGGGITPPSTPAEIEAFVAAVRAQTDSHSHGDNAGMAQEHMQVLDLVPHAEVTHIAINNGDWFDPGTWYQGQIPGEGAQAIIPEGLSVTYDGESDASLFTLRVDGELSFATQTDTRMVIDTMVVSPTGRLEIGTEDNPIADGVNADIVIANNGNINTNWDPQLFSRGVISHGDVEIHGAEKTAFLKVDDAPMAGDTSITLAEVPEGWQVGDTLVLSGTHKQGWVWDNDERRVIHRESEDEEVVITGINGSTLTIDRPLEYDHDTPRADLSAYVANMSRNITFSSEDGEGTPLHHRGHVMFMHSDDVDVRYAAFDDLGRTDKSEPAFDVGDLGHVASDSNIKSRYPFHLHKTGTEAQEDPAIAIGNTVSGSPGWGFVHHQSHATFTDNVAFDVFGAAFAAEDGNETGIWSHNMAIRSEGIGWGDFMAKDAGDVARHDNGRTGDGFFFAGRLVEASDNVAVNTTHGFVWMHRSAPLDPLSENMNQPEFAYGAETIPHDHAVIQGFHNNEAFGTSVGLIVVKASFEQWHDGRSVFDGFLNWETAYGVDISYTSHYTFQDFDLIGTNSDIPFMEAATGFNLGADAFDMVMNGLNIEGFETGVDLDPITVHFDPADVNFDNVLIDVTMSDVTNQYHGFNSGRHTIMSSSQLNTGELGFTMTGDTVISEGETLFLNGFKTDSIGTRDRQFAGDTQRLTFYDNIAPLIANEGYYKTSDGRNVILVEDFISDRATGELFKFSHVITLDMTDQQIERSWAIEDHGGPQYNGIINFDNRAAETQDDFASTNAGEDVFIDVLANDFHAAGDDLRVDGLSTTPNGNVYVQDDGRLLYRPNPDFTGTDTFDYWAADEDGQFTQGTVTVEVWDI